MENTVTEVECVDCGDEIPKARLRANPKTDLCVTCQEEAERKGRFKRHRMTQKVEFNRDGTEVESVENVIVTGDAL